MIHIQSTKFTDKQNNESYGFLIWDDLSSTFIRIEGDAPKERPLDILQYCLSIADDNRNTVFGAMFEEIEEEEEGIVVDGKLLSWDSIKAVL